MASGFGGNLNFISKATASASASIEFTSGIDSTYKGYVFYFVNMHPSSDNVNFQFNLSTDGGSTYAVTKTTTYIYTEVSEGGSGGALGYNGSLDLAQSTSYQSLMNNVGADSDQGVSGYIHLFNPSSTTFVKHFITKESTNASNDYSYSSYVAGYGNTTSAINAVDFKMSSGNIDAGEILLFGVN
jgi:hypothetical protein